MLPDADLLLFHRFFRATWATCRAARSVAANRKKREGEIVEILVWTRSRVQGRSRVGGRDLQIVVIYATGTIYGRWAKGPRTRRSKGLRENLKTFGGACRPDPHRLGDLRRRARPQQRSGAVRWLHQSGVLPEYAWRSADDRCSASLRKSGRPVASAGLSVGIGRRHPAWPNLLPHSVWHNPACASVCTGLGQRGSDIGPSFHHPSGLVTGASDMGYTGAGLTLTTSVNTGVGPATPVPEASTWAMMLIGFAGLGLTVYRPTRRRAAPLTA